MNINNINVQAYGEEQLDFQREAWLESLIIWVICPKVIVNVLIGNVWI